MRYCKYCGKELPDTSKFCSSCGQQIITENSQTEKVVNSKPINSKTIIIILSVCVVLAIIALGIVLFSINSDNEEITEDTETIFEVDDILSWQEQYDLGVKYLNDENYDEAIIAFETAIEIDPMNADAYIALADVYIATDELELALDILTKGYNYTQDDTIDTRLEEVETLIAWQEQYDLGMTYYDDKNYIDAIIAFEAAIDISNEKADAYLALADVYVDMGNTNSAIEFLYDSTLICTDPQIEEKFQELSLTQQEVNRATYIEYVSLSDYSYYTYYEIDHYQFVDLDGNGIEEMLVVLNVQAELSGFYDRYSLTLYEFYAISNNEITKVKETSYSGTSGGVYETLVIMTDETGTEFSLMIDGFSNSWGNYGPYVCVYKYANNELTQAYYYSEFDSSDEYGDPQYESDSYNFLYKYYKWNGDLISQEEYNELTESNLLVLYEDAIVYPVVEEITDVSEMLDMIAGVWDSRSNDEIFYFGKENETYFSHFGWISSEYDFYEWLPDTSEYLEDGLFKVTCLIRAYPNDNVYESDCYMDISELGQGILKKSYNNEYWVTLYYVHDDYTEGHAMMEEYYIWSSFFR